MEKLQMTIEELEPIVMELKEKIDTILNTADEAEKKYNHDKGVSEFTERNKETLDKYTDTLKKLNGDDFDLYSSAYDEYNESIKWLSKSSNFEVTFPLYYKDYNGKSVRKIHTSKSLDSLLEYINSRITYDINNGTSKLEDEVILSSQIVTKK